MIKMIIFFVLFLISFAALFFAKDNIQFFAAVTGMCAFAYGFLIIAKAEDSKRDNLLKQSDLYDYSAE
jgi:membrane associated rhomboid family serine protease